MKKEKADKLFINTRYNVDKTAQRAVRQTVGVTFPLGNPRELFFDFLEPGLIRIIFLVVDKVALEVMLSFKV